MMKNTDSLWDTVKSSDDECLDAHRLGLKPASIHARQRALEVVRAIDRYKGRVPHAWFIEIRQYVIKYPQYIPQLINDSQDCDKKIRDYIIRLSVAQYEINRAKEDIK